MRTYCLFIYSPHSLSPQATAKGKMQCAETRVMESKTKGKDTLAAPTARSSDFAEFEFLA